MKKISLFLFLGILFLGIGSACTDNQRILRLSSDSNAHGEVYNGSGDYPIEICYSDIFGQDYTGENPHQCTGDNKVLGLSASTNAHAESCSTVTETGCVYNFDDECNEWDWGEKTGTCGWGLKDEYKCYNKVDCSPDPYPIDVCYGDLVCRPTRTNCQADEKCVVTLSSNTNAHLAPCDSPDAYATKICCKSEVKEVEMYWAEDSIGNNKIDVAIKETDVYAIIKNLATGLNINYEIRKNKLFEDEIFKEGVFTSQGDSENIEWSAGYNEIGGKYEEGIYYFRISTDAKQTWLSTKKGEEYGGEYGELEVRSGEDCGNGAINEGEECDMGPEGPWGFCNSLTCQCDSGYVPDPDSNGCIEAAKWCREYDKDQTNCENCGGDDPCNAGIQSENDKHSEDKNWPGCGIENNWTSEDGCVRYYDCLCWFNDTSEECHSKYKVITHSCPPEKGDVPNIGECRHTDNTNDNCDDGFFTYSWTAQWIWDETNTGEYCISEGNPEGCIKVGEKLYYDPDGEREKCRDGSRTIPCPAQVELPFFTWQTLVATIIILGAIYWLWNLKKTRKKIKRKIKFSSFPRKLGKKKKNKKIKKK